MGDFSLFDYLSVFEFFDIDGISIELGGQIFCIFVLLSVSEFPNLRDSSFELGRWSFSPFYITYGPRLTASINAVLGAQLYRHIDLHFCDFKPGLDTQFHDGLSRYRRRVTDTSGIWQVFTRH